ncbi:MAG: hypothetical protein AAGA92_00525 [Planctomycetota bacterium]
MGTFSERMGIVEVPAMLQLDEMPPALKNSLWNVLLLTFQDKNWSNWNIVCRHAAIGFYKVPADELPMQEHQSLDWFKVRFFALPWYHVYDLVEFIVTRQTLFGEISGGKSETRLQILLSGTNRVLEEERAGYRLTQGVFAAITSNTETGEIQEAVQNASAHGVQGASTHLDTAIRHFSKRPDPDYRNAIKEAISAVESAAKVLSGEAAGGLESALSALSEKTELHSALRSAFCKLYGYTSDEDGIRHAILEEKDVGFDEAKYMIVSCSAFVNFLIAKAVKAGVIESGR